MCTWAAYACLCAAVRPRLRLTVIILFDIQWTLAICCWRFRCVISAGVCLHISGPHQFVYGSTCNKCILKLWMSFCSSQHIVLPAVAKISPDSLLIPIRPAAVTEWSTTIIVNNQHNHEVGYASQCERLRAFCCVGSSLAFRLRRRTVVVVSSSNAVWKLVVVTH